MINRTNIGGDMIGKTANKINAKGSRTGKGKMANTIDKKVGTTIDPMGSKAGSKSNVTKTVRLRLLSAGQDLGGGSTESGTARPFTNHTSASNEKK